MKVSYEKEDLKKSRFITRKGVDGYAHKLHDTKR